MTFSQVCDTLASVLQGPTRAAIVEAAARHETLGPALLDLRTMLRSNVWAGHGQAFDLERAIYKLDRKTRQVGFHVLHDWDGIADRVNDDTIPVDVLHYLVDRRGSEPTRAGVLATLVDYHFMHLLALLSVRLWDEGDPDDNLDRVGTLLSLLQGPAGSGQRFAADAETLLLIATSHYELHERGYSVLLEQVRTLNRAHQLRIALGHASSMGCHLRFGFEATYGRDTTNMRDDNVADYPWLCFALARVMEEYERVREDGDGAGHRAQVVEALLNGLTGDARAFVGAPPSSLAGSEDERAAFRDRFLAYREDLLAEFEPFRPQPAQSFTPLAFFFNFSHNVLKGIVIDALLEDRPWPVTFNDLLSGLGTDELARSKREAAETLMEYARANPHRIRGRLRPVIVYDISSGREAFSVTMRKLRQ